MFKTRRWIASAVEASVTEISLPWQRVTERAEAERDLTAAVFLRAARPLEQQAA